MQCPPTRPAPSAMNRDPPSGAALSNVDLEAGGEEPSWTSWARQAAQRARSSASEAADQASRAATDSMERAKSVDWSEQANKMQSGVSDSLEVFKDRASLSYQRTQDNVSSGVEKAKSVDWSDSVRGIQRGLSTSFETISTTASSAAVVVQEKGQAGVDVTKEYSQTARLSVESIHLTETFTKAKDTLSTGASSVAGVATGAISGAGERVSSLRALTISPTTWAQFIGVFLMGTLFIMLSLNFLPILLISPQKFALTFTIGSVTMLSSFVIFSGPTALLTSMSQRDKLPFSILYVVGLIGTLFATLLMRSYVLTAIFALVQAVSLLYFVASYLPGGKAMVNACCRCCGRSARSIMSI